MTPEKSIEELASLVRNFVLKGEYAEDEADDQLSAAEEHYITAGNYLKELKSRKVGPWPQFVKEKCGLSQTRADQLIRIANGKTTLEKVRGDAAARMKRMRARQKEEEEAEADPVSRDTDPPAPEPDQDESEPEPEPSDDDDARPPEPEEAPPLPRDQELLMQFSAAVLELKRLAARPSDKFVGTSIDGGDLEMVSNFLAQIAQAKTKPTAAAA